jgi:hypothetical protein
MKAARRGFQKNENPWVLLSELREVFGKEDEWEWLGKPGIPATIR